MFVLLCPLSSLLSSPSCVASATLFIFHIQCVSCVLRKLRIHIESPSGHILKLRPAHTQNPPARARAPYTAYLVAESLSLCTTLFNVISISPVATQTRTCIHIHTCTYVIPLQCATTWTLIKFLRQHPEHINMHICI